MGGAGVVEQRRCFLSTTQVGVGGASFEEGVRVKPSERRGEEHPRQREQVCVQGLRVGEGQMQSSRENGVDLEGDPGESGAGKTGKPGPGAFSRLCYVEFGHYPASKDIPGRF